MAGETSAVATAARQPRDFLSLGLAAKQTRKRPRAITKPGNFTGVFDDFAYSGGEEWI
jgi:hypothetical protein